MTLPHNAIAIPEQINGQAPDAVPSLWNNEYAKCLANDQALNTRLVAREQELSAARSGHSSLAARLSAMGADIATLSPEAQAALWAAVENAVADTGLLAREMVRSRTVRHQEGEFTIYNRGIRRGCGITKSLTASRNLNIAAGVVFMLGQEMGVDAAENAASVPGNSGAAAATADAYLYLTGGRMRLAVTGLGESAPESALLLARLNIPAGNTGASDPNLSGVTITTVARVEPDWPSVQTNPAFRQQALGRVMGRSGYALAFDVISYAGGEPPLVVSRDQDRATNTFRAYLIGSSDAVRVRYLAHLMNQ
ncbi:MAG: hypothetical protein RBR49_12565 [Desulfovibrio desulfuricans]|jgi:hypothetical protein|nr:hypothetical protein [Desulfovibrio desulfuricans]